MRRNRTLFAVVGALALLAACSGSFTGNSEPASGRWPVTRGTAAPGLEGRRIAAGTDVTAAERSAHFTVAFAGPGDGDRTTIRATGGIDFSSQDLSIRVDLGDTGFGDAAGGTAEIRVVDGVFYADLSGLGDAATGLPEGKRWLRLDIAGLADLIGGADVLAESANPLGGLEALRGVSSDVEEIGPEVLRGVETTHYRATVDLAAALGDAPAGTRDRARDLFDRAGDEEIPVDVWLDAQGRVRKYTMRLGASGRAAAVTYELYDFGAPVEVGPPPPDEVADLGSLFGELTDRLIDGLTGRSTDDV